MEECTAALTESKYQFLRYCYSFDSFALPFYSLHLKPSTTFRGSKSCGRQKNFKSKPRWGRKHEAKNIIKERKHVEMKGVKEKKENINIKTPLSHS
jgi:hypothetical protein